MKKLILMLSFALIAGACKKSEPKSETMERIVSDEVAVEADCSIFDTLNTMSASDQVTWLHGKQDQICAEAYDDCRVRLHKISEQDFTAAVADYWADKTPIYTDIVLRDITAMTPETKYGKFIGTSKNSSDEVVLSVENNFTETPSCYSLPLFYSLKRKFNLDSQSIIKFTFGRIKNADVVIFSIKGMSEFYDMSNCPL